MDTSVEGTNHQPLFYGGHFLFHHASACFGLTFAANAALKLNNVVFVQVLSVL